MRAIPLSLAAVLALAALPGSAAAQHHMHGGFFHPQMMNGNASPFMRHQRFFQPQLFQQQQSSALALAQQQSLSLAQQRAISLAQQRTISLAQQRAVLFPRSQFTLLTGNSATLFPTSSLGVPTQAGVTQLSSSGGFVVPFSPIIRP